MAELIAFGFPILLLAQGVSVTGYLIYVALTKNFDPESLKQIAGVRNRRLAAVLALIAILLGSLLLIGSVIRVQRQRGTGHGLRHAIVDHVNG
jgi:hypothetical protein